MFEIWPCDNEFDEEICITYVDLMLASRFYDVGNKLP